MDAIHHGKATAKLGQEKQIWIEKQSVKKATVLKIGNNLIIPTGASEDGYYKVGTAAGTLDRRYLSTEIE